MRKQRRIPACLQSLTFTEQKYPDGLLGVWNSRKAELDCLASAVAPGAAYANHCTWRHLPAMARDRRCGRCQFRHP